MNEKLKEFAAQAGFNLSVDYHCDEYELEQFAQLVRQDEREACANLSDKHDDDVGMAISRAIRARGEPNPAFKNYLDDKWSGIV
jgi:hypothetical protein